MLRHVDAPQPADVQPVFDAELRVAAGTWLDGAQVRDVMKRTGGRLPLRQIRRANGSLASPLPTATLRAGDRLVVQDTAGNLKDYEARLKTPLHSFDDETAGTAGTAAAAGHVDAADTDHHAVAAQLVITPESPLVGRTARGLRLAAAPLIVPSGRMMPARYMQAMASMMPEPQMPVTPCSPTCDSNSGSSDHSSQPITRKRGSSVSGSMRTRSMAPGAAR